MELKTRAYPKVNIGLYIGRKTEQGFHDLVSIFQKIDCVYDDIAVSFKKAGKTSIRVRGLEDCADSEKNTCYDAARLFLEKSGINAEVCIGIEKRIPVKAGIGGGSSDAASVLLALQELAGKPLGMQDLMDCAATVGSDVPFFMQDSRAAFVSGRGQIIHPIKARTDLKFALYKSPVPKEGTAKAYAILDASGLREELPSEEELVLMYNRPVSQWSFENDFERLSRKPSGVDEKEGRLYMSGAGDTWYLVTDNSNAL